MSAAPHYSDFGFADPEHVRNYAQGAPSMFLPGFAMMHRLVIQLISETAGEEAHILALGAGGGLELAAMAAVRPGWRFTAVDPAPLMIAEAKQKLGAVADRVDWVEGYIEDAPELAADAATCLLTLHFVPDDGGKLATLRQIHARLKPGGAFAVVDYCVHKGAPNYRRQMNRHATFARESGVPAEDVANMRERLERLMVDVTPEREEELLAEAGFVDIDLFFAGLSWRGWTARAGVAP